jgi:hypothetical protein
VIRYRDNPGAHDGLRGLGLLSLHDLRRQRRQRRQPGGDDAISITVSGDQLSDSVNVGNDMLGSGMNAPDSQNDFVSVLDPTSPALASPTSRG